MANKPYPNFVLENKIEDQIESRLDLQTLCTVDRSLQGTAGMIKKINVYRATNGTEILDLKEGNTKIIEAGYTDADYTIKLAQNRGIWYDEEQMADPLIGMTIARHSGVDLYNTMQRDIYAEFGKTSQTVTVVNGDFFGAFVDAQAMLDVEAVNAGAPTTFAIVSPAVLAEIRKALKDDLKYVEAFAREGYVGTVAGTNIYVRRNVEESEDEFIAFATREAVTLFVKTGTEVELYQANNRSADDANVRKNTIFSRKYYLPALTDETKAVKILLSGGDDGGDDGGDTDTPSVTLSDSTITVGAGATETLTATTVPADAVVTWTSSDETKATVADGVVTGEAAGSATITATITVDGVDYTDTCAVTVSSQD